MIMSSVKEEYPIQMILPERYRSVNDFVYSQSLTIQWRITILPMLIKFHKYQAPPPPQKKKTHKKLS